MEKEMCKPHLQCDLCQALAPAGHSQGGSQYSPSFRQFSCSSSAFYRISCSKYQWYEWFTYSRLFESAIRHIVRRRGKPSPIAQALSCHWARCFLSSSVVFQPIASLRAEVGSSLEASSVIFPQGSGCERDRLCIC